MNLHEIFKGTFFEEVLNILRTRQYVDSEEELTYEMRSLGTLNDLQKAMFTAMVNQRSIVREKHDELMRVSVKHQSVSMESYSFGHVTIIGGGLTAKEELHPEMGKEEEFKTINDELTKEKIKLYALKTTFEAFIAESFPEVGHFIAICTGFTVATCTCTEH